MRGHGLPTAEASTAAVLTASGHPGPWPSVSIWHGDADHTVTPANADALVAQWRGVYDLKSEPDETRRVGGHVNRLWRNSGGDVVLEDYRISGMGHGVPIATHSAEPCEVAGPYFLDAGVSASLTLVTKWKLASGDRLDHADHQPAPRPQRRERHEGTRTTTAAEGRDVTVSVTRVESVEPPAVGSIQGVIEDALRRAGLMR
ncbi:hypothetical protein BH10PSE2_BH10PSE2_10370 [soil metagenome]